MAEAALRFVAPFYVASIDAPLITRKRACMLDWHVVCLTGGWLWSRRSGGGQAMDATCGDAALGQNVPSGQSRMRSTQGLVVSKHKSADSSE